MSNRDEFKHTKTFENSQYIITNAWATPNRILASKLGITIPTLYKYYREEMHKSNALIIEQAVESAMDLLNERDYRITDKILSKIGRLKDADTGNNNINISLNSYVDKPRDLTLDEWLKTYDSKKSKPKTIEHIEDAEVIEDE